MASGFWKGLVCLVGWGHVFKHTDDRSDITKVKVTNKFRSIQPKVGLFKDPVNGTRVFPTNTQIKNNSPLNI